PQTRLTVNSAYHIYDFPAWSLDGAQIAFESYGGGIAPRIYVMNADGSGLTQIADSVSATRIAWVGAGVSPPPPPPHPPPVPPPPPPPPPQGRIAFVTSRDGNAEIYVMNAGGSGVTRLTHHAAGD